MKKTILGLFVVLCSSMLHAQERWTFEQCIAYAIEHNAQVKKAAIANKEYEIRLNTAQNSRLPDMNAMLGQNVYFGRGPSRDGTYKDNTQLSTTMNATANLTVFAAGRIKHDIQGRRFDLQAAMQDLQRAREDLSLNVTSMFLQVLFCKELIVVAQKQVELSRTLVERNELLLKGGRSVEAELLESQASLSNDELNLANTENDLTLALLDLSQALNRSTADGFDIEPPTMDSITHDAVQGLMLPGSVFDLAVESRPMVKAEELRLKSSLQSLRTAQSARYPQIALSGGYSNSYFYSFVAGYNNVGFLHQLRNNGNEFIGLNISIPVFNRLATRNQIRSARANVELQEVVLSETKQALRKEIEQAYYNVKIAYKKYNTSEKSFESAKAAFDYEAERASAGRSNMYDYNEAKMRMEKAESNMLQAKYELIFNRKILDFYAGQPLTLQ